MALDVAGFVKRWQKTGEIFEEVPLHMPSNVYLTRACWIDLPEAAGGTLAASGLDMDAGLHAAAHAKDPVPKRAASNLKVFTDALDELRELQEATPSPIPAEEGHAGPLVGSMAWFLLEVLVCCSVFCPFDLRRWRFVRLYATDATPSTRRQRRPARATSTT